MFQHPEEVTAYQRGIQAGERDIVRLAQSAPRPERILAYAQEQERLLRLALRPVDRAYWRGRRTVALDAAMDRFCRVEASPQDAGKEQGSE
jgi:hypothetical protein